MKRSQIELANELVHLGRACGLDEVGFASADPFVNTREELERRASVGLNAGMHFTYSDPTRSTSPSASLPNAASLVVGARSYYKAPVTPERNSGRVARYSWTNSYELLRLALGQIADYLHNLGFNSRVMVDDNALVDREAAFRAGLGWYGKNSNLLLPGKGSWFLLGSVITDASLPTSKPIESACGACTRCISNCPTNAIVEPGVVDARRCLAWLLQAPGIFPRQFRRALGDRIYGCDDCQEVCPPNRKAEEAASHPDDEASVSLVEMLDTSDQDLLARFERWYVPKRQPRYLRRNALIALGNIGDGDDPEVIRVLRNALMSSDFIIRAHAVWAAAQLNRIDLLKRTDVHPDVQAELDEVFADALV